VVEITSITGEKRALKAFEFVLVVSTVLMIVCIWMPAPLSLSVQGWTLEILRKDWASEELGCFWVGAAALLSLSALSSFNNFKCSCLLITVLPVASSPKDLQLAYSQL
jgi:hypothetical protein